MLDSSCFRLHLSIFYLNIEEKIVIAIANFAEGVPSCLWPLIIYFSISLSINSGFVHDPPTIHSVYTTLDYAN